MTATGVARRVAVMQPYFYPYAGYFRLLQQADVFVLFDCVQFIRRGRIHRTQLGHTENGPWLTLPLAPQKREVRICDLQFADNARSTFDQRLQQHSWIAAANGPLAPDIRAHLYSALDTPVDFLHRGLELVARSLGIKTRIVRSSTLGLPDSARAQERVIAAVQAVRGSHYVNAPGGRDLYQRSAFEAAGLALSFLTPYQGAYPYMLRALLEGAPGDIAADITRSSELSD